MIARGGCARWTGGRGPDGGILEDCVVRRCETPETRPCRRIKAGQASLQRLVGRHVPGVLAPPRTLALRSPLSPPSHDDVTNMTARRQPSTTSLSKFARDGSPDPAARSLDFCNAFWGLSDGGVDVLFARMRGAGRTTEELRNFWKERSVYCPAPPDCIVRSSSSSPSHRAAIEEDYAKRLAKLAKMSVGRDEIGFVPLSLA